VIELVELLADVGHAVVGVRVEARLQVRPRRETAAGPGDQHRAHALVRRIRADHLLQLDAEVLGPGVEGIGPVEGDPADARVHVPDHMFVSHGPEPKQRR
jgi:hypothetical protein